MKASLFIGWTLALASGAMAAQPPYQPLPDDPSNEEQLWLELINRMRLNPQAELAILTNINPCSPATWGNPKSSDSNVAKALTDFRVNPDILRDHWYSLLPAPPLAWNNNLHKSAKAHNDEIIAHDAQEHQFPGEPDYPTRIRNAGYPYYGHAAENVYAFAESPFHGHAAFAIDWGKGYGGLQNPPGHQRNLMDADLREVGIAISKDNNPSTQVGPLVVTQDFGARFDIIFITGVIYNDAIVRDNFYTPLEGLGSVNVAAYQAGTSTLVASIPTTASGGYALKMVPGVYDVKISGAGLAAPITYRNVAIYENNVKIDSLSIWIRPADGDWSSPSNWSSGVPNGPGTVASCYNSVSAPSDLFVNTPISVGTLNFENPFGYALVGGGSLTLETVTGPSRINVIGVGSHAIRVFQVNAYNTTIDIAADATLAVSSPLQIRGAFKRTGAGTLHLASIFYSGGASSTLSFAGGTTHIAARNGLDIVSVTGSASRLNLDASQEITSLGITGGTVTLSPGGSKTILANQLFISGGGKLDLNDNMLVLFSSPYSQGRLLQTIGDLIRAARGSTDNYWVGSGITSSIARDDKSRITGLVVVPNIRDSSGMPLFDILEGKLIPTSSVLVKYSLNGDVNLDGMIDAADYFRIDSGYITQRPGYHNGDFNFDGMIDAADYFLIDSAYIGQCQVSIAGVSPRFLAVPEPGAFDLLMATALLLRGRRGRPGSFPAADQQNGRERLEPRPAR